LPRSSLSRRCERAQPGRLHHPNSRGEGGQKNGRLPGDHGISRPATAQGRPSDRRHLYAAVRSFLRVPFAQQTAGASRHPAFPVPSWIQRVARPGKARANCAARTRRRVCKPSCVPQAGSRKVDTACALQLVRDTRQEPLVRGGPSTQPRRSSRRGAETDVISPWQNLRLWSGVPTRVFW
jgi:hypothetical protein